MKSMPRNICLRLRLVVALACLALGACSTHPQLERLEDEVTEMQHYQRTADNLAFYRARQRAERYLRLAGRTARFFSEEDRLRYAHAQTQYHLTSAAYYYMLSQQNRAAQEMLQIDEDNPLTASTRQWLEYRYLCGLYGYGPEVGRLGIRQCQGIANQLAASDDYWRVEARLIEASLLNNDGDFSAALDTLRSMEPLYVEHKPDALNAELFPESLSRLYEQMSVAYAGLGDKYLSDSYRNQYLDLLNEIREDKELPARRAELEKRVSSVRRLFFVTIAFIALAAALLWLLARRWRKRGREYLSQLNEQLDEERRDAGERYALHQLQAEKNKRDNIMRKASLSIVTGVIPLIDRMRREIHHKGDYEYVSELAQEIDYRNEVLAKWIQTRQGMVNLHIENFALQDIFDIVAKNKPSFSAKGIHLDVLPTDATVKADKALTLFMLNTLMDNAQKFTPKDGTVRISAETEGDYVEIGVEDTGIGLTPEEKRRILDEKVLTSDNHGFGILNCKGIIDKYRKTDDFFRVCRFGIESEKGKGSRFWFRLPKALRKATTLIALCLLLVAPSACTPSDSLFSQDVSFDSNTETAPYDSLLTLAADFADSVYYANTEARYEDAFTYADSAFACLNRHCRLNSNTPLDTLASTGKGHVVERDWWMADFATDYFTILDLRNELAVASLALNRWADYRYNNRAYTTLYKLQSIDLNIAKDCRRMQRTYADMVGLIVVLLVVALLFALCYYLLLVRPRNRLHRLQEQHIKEQSSMVEEDSGLSRLQFEENRLYVQNQVLDNCLSSIKHETLFYPGRIRHMVENNAFDDLPELVDYYSEVYMTLTACAARQLEASTFRRSAVSLDSLFSYADSYLRKKSQAKGVALTLSAEPSGLEAEGDNVLLQYMMEVLMDDALTLEKEGTLKLSAQREGDFVQVEFADERIRLSEEELQQFFEPSTEHAHVLMRQIIREHDEYFNHPGCRILASFCKEDEGLCIRFTIPIHRGKHVSDKA
ncbi:MAG: DUF5113 domain-containing protein [Bacteroidaceae bacterium]|nr:DUF5113 domain-containing protein [Bacteroidaceae bacterium]